MTPEEIAALLQQPDKQQALLDVLRGKQSLGYAAQLSGDRVLAPFGAGLQREVADTQRLDEASRRTAAYEKSVQAGLSATLGRGERDAQRLELEREREARKTAALPGALARKTAAAKSKADEKAKAGAFRDSSVLRKEFNALPDVKSYNESRTSFEKIDAAAKNPSAAGDLALIFSYMKVLDPGSTVREGEFANAQNAAGVPERIRNVWNKAARGERLNDAQRQDFVRQAKSLFSAQQKAYAEQAKRYRALAEKSGVDPDDITGALTEASPAPSQAQSVLRMRFPDGNTYDVPADKVGAARRRGGVEVAE